MKNNTNDNEVFFHFLVDKFLEMEEIDPSELSDEDGGWLLYIAEFFYNQGMLFAISKERGLLIKVADGTKH